MIKAPHQQRLLFYCLAAALPLFLVASLFNYSLLKGEGHYLFGSNLEILGYLIQAEFLAVASGILILIPLLVRSTLKYIRWFLTGMPEQRVLFYLCCAGQWVFLSMFPCSYHS
ncbi:hypothetical protein N9H66_00415, partial [bacterium]|nr:hypothetical protein [bacterium]